MPRGGAGAAASGWGRLPPRKFGLGEAPWAAACRNRGGQRAQPGEASSARPVGHCRGAAREVGGAGEATRPRAAAAGRGHGWAGAGSRRREDPIREVSAVGGGPPRRARTSAGWGSVRNPGNKQQLERQIAQPRGRAVSRTQSRGSGRAWGSRAEPRPARGADRAQARAVAKIPSGKAPWATACRDSSRASSRSRVGARRAGLSRAWAGLGRERPREAAPATRRGPGSGPRRREDSAPQDATGDGRRASSHSR